MFTYAPGHVDAERAFIDSAFNKDDQCAVSGVNGTSCALKALQVEDENLAVTAVGVLVEFDLSNCVLALDGPESREKLTTDGNGWNAGALSKDSIVGLSGAKKGVSFQPKR